MYSIVLLTLSIKVLTIWRPKSTENYRFRRHDYCLTPLARESLQISAWQKYESLAYISADNSTGLFVLNFRADLRKTHVFQNRVLDSRTRSSRSLIPVAVVSAYWLPISDYYQPWSCIALFLRHCDLQTGNHMCHLTRLIARGERVLISAGWTLSS